MMFRTIRCCSSKPYQTQWVNPILYIYCKLVKIISALKYNRILMHKPSRIRLIVTEEVIVQPRLFIKILILQTERLVRILINPLVFVQLTPSGIFAVPYQITKLVGHFFRNTDLVVMEIG